jgi:hypothetical protein
MKLEFLKDLSDKLEFEDCNNDLVLLFEKLALKENVFKERTKERKKKKERKREREREKERERERV